MLLALTSLGPTLLLLPARGQASNACDEQQIMQTAAALRIADYGQNLPSSYVRNRFDALKRYDAGAWHELMQFFIEVGDPNAALTYEILPLVLHLPEPLRQSLDARLRDSYVNAKNELGRRFEGDRIVFTPKRALSAYGHQTSNAHLTAVAMRQEGRMPAEFLDAYFGSVRGRFFQQGAAPWYRGREVLDIASIVQGQLRAGAGGKDVELILFGSLPNGRAGPRSDLDGLPMNQATVTALNTRLQTIRNELASRFPGTQWHLAMPEASITPNQAASMSPVQIRITSEKISLLIFPPTVLSKYSYLIPGGSSASTERAMEWPLTP